MPHAYLTNDILLYILAFADNRQLCALMQTCRMLHHHGAKYLLQNGVYLRADRQIASFMQFMLGDREHTVYRVRLLRALTLCGGRPPEAQGPLTHADESAGLMLNALFNFIRSFGWLVHLTIYDAEEILSMHPSLSDTIAQLETLRYLYVLPVGPRTATMLKALRSPLLHAVVGIDPEARGNDQLLPLEDQNPMRLLRGSQHSLRQLSVGHCVSAPDGPEYPNVKHLALNFTDVPEIQHYVRAFPRLRTLAIADCRARDEENFDDYRARNQAAQDQLGTWSSLRAYSGPIMNLYLVGLRCPIRTLRIDNEMEDLDPHALRAVLADARPQRLQLRMDGGHWLLDPDFLSAFAHPGVADLRLFAFSIRFMQEDQDLDVTAFLDSIVSRVVAPLPALVSFRLRLDCYSIDPNAFLRQTVEDYPIQPLEEDLAHWDMESYARRIQREAVATRLLHSVTVCMEGNRIRADHIASYGPAAWEHSGCSSDDEDEGKY